MSDADAPNFADLNAKEAPGRWTIAIFTNGVKLFVEGGGLGMEHNGRVCIMPPEKWHAMGWSHETLRTASPHKRGTDGFCHTCASYTCSALEST